MTFLSSNRVDTNTRKVSLTAPPPTNATGRMLTKDDSPVTKEDFYSCINKQLHKVESFTLQCVMLLQSKISCIKKAVGSIGQTPEEIKHGHGMAEAIARSFLTLKKYVIINFVEFHKILKKHDKNSPAHACKQFYINRMHNQAWVRGDYSNVVVRLSAIYSTLRDDHVTKENKNAAQAFSRQTTRYWVRTEVVSKIKYVVLKHLPVFLQKTSTGETGSQLTNNIFFDNKRLGEFQYRQYDIRASFDGRGDRGAL